MNNNKMESSHKNEQEESPNLNNDSIVRFEAFSSTIDASFWSTLSQEKLNTFKLDESPKKIYGYYENNTTTISSTTTTTTDNHHLQLVYPPSRFNVEADAFTKHHISNILSSSLQTNNERIRQDFKVKIQGKLLNFNKIEGFKALDKAKLLQEAAQEIWDKIKSDEIVNHPASLNSFIIISYADLKRYKFWYWCCFPTLVFQSHLFKYIAPSTDDASILLKNGGVPQPIMNCISDSQINQLKELFSSDTYISIIKDGFFGIEIHHENNDNLNFVRILTLKDIKDTQIENAITHQQNTENKKSSSSSSILFAFIDPSSLPDHPGWPLRNYLAWIKYKFNQLKSVKILTVRNDLLSLSSSSSSSSNSSTSLIMNINLRSDSIESTSESSPKAVGWERNAAGQMGPRSIDLSPLMNPEKLAETAVDLNLKLMKWRILPDLNLQKISSLKCLLLGAGTLGSHVARGLLGWGVRHITFVDNGKVSFSNPVRQPLFTFQHSLNGGQFKAKMAAESLEEIFPSVTSEGRVFSIPMPGHFIHDKESTKNDIQKLEELIKTHDVVFLLTDSRESRWLPTVLGAYHGKIVMNAALGFDTFLVMRHGMRQGKDSTHSDFPKLGCYFCNDVVAPQDSLSDRTLDQQCTVTRPGGSAIASAMLIELLASIVTHSEGPWANASTPIHPTDPLPPNSSILGLVPHQIRGFLSHFTQLIIVGQYYDKCVACSTSILETYRRQGVDFILNAIEDPSLLEKVAGLSEMKQVALEQADEFYWDDEDGDDF